MVYRSSVLPTAEGRRVRNELTFDLGPLLEERAVGILCLQMWFVVGTRRGGCSSGFQVVGALWAAGRASGFRGAGGGSRERPFSLTATGGLRIAAPAGCGLGLRGSQLGFLWSELELRRGPGFL